MSLAFLVWDGLGNGSTSGKLEGAKGEDLGHYPILPVMAVLEIPASPVRLQLWLDVPPAMSPAATNTDPPWVWFLPEGPEFWVLPRPFSLWHVSGSCSDVLCFSLSSLNYSITYAVIEHTSMFSLLRRLRVSRLDPN